ncbi:DUF2806 domain-containing protein [Gluconobacter sp. R75690]|uniref:DUF2806 domain-containing protein n=1 Tax=unclassified Gluconobacter TaxID=2644261 RepID=UPI00188A64B9|nr:MULTISPECIES: DUF2806 domain-containing protein [unclassified Gluconobacter]MBF0851453.1 DUF2806 domain-containing protein [Gluconobacter sp. R75690]MBF0880066.1 DUF2806 domain-containing protein [Gluconobacter sp. R75828]
MTSEPSKSGIVGNLTAYGSSVSALAVIFAGHPVSATIVALWASRPVREAISRLICGSLEIPEAWLRNKKLSIDAQGLSEQAVLKGFSEKVTETTLSSESIKGRAEHYALTVIEKKQKTRENISQKTLEYLAEGEPTDEASAPSEDFMRSFEAVAEKTSSDELQDMMARILAGEIRKPNSISRATLAVADILDKEIIESMIFIKPYIINKIWVCADACDFNELRFHANLLSSVRITNEIGPHKHGFNEEGYAVLQYQSGAIYLELKDKSRARKFTPFTDGFNITRIGSELISILPDINEVKIEEIANSYSKNKYIENVSVGDVVEVDGNNFFQERK